MEGESLVSNHIISRYGLKAIFYSLPMRSGIRVLLLEVVFLFGKQFGEKS